MGLIPLVATFCFLIAQDAGQLNDIVGKARVLVAFDGLEPLEIDAFRALVVACGGDSLEDPDIQALASIDHRRLQLSELTPSEFADSVKSYRTMIRPLQDQADRAMLSLEDVAWHAFRSGNYEEYILARSAQRGLVVCMLRIGSPANHNWAVPATTQLMRDIRRDISRGEFPPKELDSLLELLQGFESLRHDEEEVLAIAAVRTVRLDPPSDLERVKRFLRQEAKLAAADRTICGDPLGNVRALSPLAEAPPPFPAALYIAASVLWERDRMLFEIRATLLHAMAHRYREVYGVYPRDLAALQNHFKDSTAFTDPIGGASFVLHRLGEPPEETYMLYSVGLDGKDDGGGDAGEAVLVDSEVTGDYVIIFRG